jgi:dissimilatory sulfite reductase (desulfoviridin) alpha/beta subunit
MEWSPEAKEAISKVPFFVRSRVKRRVEQEAKSRGDKRVLMEHVLACQRRYLTSMEEEVRGYQVDGCFGPSGCPNRAVVIEGLLGDIEACCRGRDLKGFLKGRVKGPLKLHHEFRISVSDCPNACSRPQIADVGLIGVRRPAKDRTAPCTQCWQCIEVCKEDALKVDGEGAALDESRCVKCGQCIDVCPTGHLIENGRGYLLLVGGKLGRHPRLAQQICGILSEGQEVIAAIEACIDFYMENCRSGERMGEIMEREGVAKLEGKLKGLTLVKETGRKGG